AHDVVAQHRARRVGRDRAAEVLLEAVIGELQALLGAVRPQVAVHARVHRLAMLVQAGAPGVVPHAAQVGLLLEADDLGHVRARAAGGIEGTQLGQAAWAGAEDGDSLGHAGCHLHYSWRHGARKRPARAGGTRWTAGKTRRNSRP